MGGNGKIMTVGGKQLPPDVQDFWEQFAGQARIVKAAIGLLEPNIPILVYTARLNILKKRIAEYQEKFGPAAAEGGAT